MKHGLRQSLVPGGPSAEWQLVLACLRASVAGERAGTVTALSELIGQGLNWGRVFDLASRHAVTPLVCQAISRVEPSALSALALALAHAESGDCASRSLELTRGLVRLLALLDANGISAVPFKGPALASLLHNNVGLRDSSDLDVLVRREDLARATELLLSYGYRTDLPTDAARQAAYLSARYEVHLKSPDGRVDVELHQGFLAPYHSVPFDYDALWKRLRPRRVCGRDMLVMESEDLLLALCAHGTKHAWARLGWLCDVARLLTVYCDELDWSEVWNRAEMLGARRMLNVALSLTANLLGADVPADIRSAAAHDARAQRLAGRVTASLQSGADGVSAAAEHLFFVAARESVRHKLGYVFRLAFTPTEEDAAAWLPGLLAPLGYPLHAARVTGKYGRALLRARLKIGSSV